MTISKKTCKFTLLELVLVAAIAAPGTGLILAVVSEAKQEAKMTVCQMNLNKIGVASRSYGDAYDDAIPPGCDFRAYRKNRPNFSWYQRIMEFNNDDPSILVCPDSTKTYAPITNSQTTRYVPDAKGLDYSAIMEVSGIWNNGERYYKEHKYSDAANPALTVHVIDGPGAIILAQAKASLERTGGQMFDLIYRHNNSANIVFLDGHVESPERPEEKELQEKYQWVIKTNCPASCKAHWHF